MNLKEVALFLTCVDPKERQEIFRLLKKTEVRDIPFSHLRSDHTARELDYLIKNYHTKVFNIHTKREYPYFPDYEKYAAMTCVENTYEPLDEKEIQEFAGICLDFSHLENNRIYEPDIYERNIKIIEKHKVGCNHISPASRFDIIVEREISYAKDRHPHVLKELSDLDYLNRYPLSYFGEYAALEMENSIKEQLEAKEYIIKLLEI